MVTLTQVFWTFICWSFICIYVLLNHLKQSKRFVLNKQRILIIKYPEEEQGSIHLFSNEKHIQEDHGEVLEANQNELEY